MRERPLLSVRSMNRGDEEKSSPSCVQRAVSYTSRIVVVVVGVFFLSGSIYLFISAGLGADPISVMLRGIALASGLSIGRTSQLISLGIIGSLYLLFRRLPGPGTVINAILVGVFLDLLFAFGVLQPGTIGVRLLILTGATASMAVGIAVYVSSGLGEGPFESLMIVLHEQGGMTVRTAKISLDVLAVLIGAGLGATIGAGTVVGAFGVGPITQLALTGIARVRAVTSIGSLTVYDETIRRRIDRR